MRAVLAACWFLMAACRAAPSAPPPTPVEPPRPAAPPDKPGRVVVTDTSVQILDPIEFEPSTSVFKAKSKPMLDAIAATLTGNPDIRLVEVRAYGTDAAPQFQKHLAEDRANAIVAYLVAKGVASARLRPAGVAAPPAGRDSRPEFTILAFGPPPHHP